MATIINEKNPGLFDAEEDKTDNRTTTVVEEDSASSDGDDALKLAGTHAHHFDEKYYTRLRRKIDLRIMPILVFIYFTQGATLDDSSGVQPPPESARVNIILWGVLVMLHAVCKNFAGFYALRFFLGMLEACVSPSLILIVSMWYKQNERAVRIGWFYAGNLSTSVVGGAVAYGVTFYEGSIAPWKLLYIILGALAISCGIIVLCFLPDSPKTASFLSEEEKVAALERVRLDQAGTHNKHIKRYQIVETFKDVRTWVMFIIIMCLGSLLLDMPRAAIGGFAVVAVGWLSDRINDRMTLVLLFTLPMLIGMVIMTTMQFSGKKGVLEFAQLFQNLAAPCFPLCYAWNASNIGGHTKKVTVNAFTLFTFGVGSVVGTYIFLPRNAPGYISGKAAIVVLTVVMMVACAVMAYINVRWNRQKKVELEQLIAANGWTEDDVMREREKAAFSDLTDMENVFFNYTR
ncbi:hypothetical protein LTR08_004461 [Meristemomyces frigidus]|nr:hypothetical protein LTR08_004461 [Meristemomyces frigidus]